MKQSKTPKAKAEPQAEIQATQDQTKPWAAVEASLSDRQDQQLGSLKPVAAVDRALERLHARFGNVIPSRGSSVSGTPLTAQEQELYQMQRANTLNALKACAALTGQMVDCKNAIREILAVTKSVTSSNEKLYCNEALATVRQKLQDLKDNFKEIAQQNPEAYLVVHSREFRRYSRQLLSGRIAITPFVSEKIDEMLGILHSTGMAMLHGPTGSGKSEVAEMVGWMHSGKKPLVISGHRDVSAREFKGHDQLKSSGRILPEQIPDHVEAAQARYRSEHPEVSGKALSEALKQIEHRVISENAVTESEFVLGYAYRAAKIGATLIIDEFNLVDPAILMGLNSLMTKREGEMVDVPENGHPPFPVAKGFAVILTGNLNTGEGTTYHRPWEPDASTINRFRPVHYGFLPQATGGAAADAHPEQKQLYQVMLSTLRSGRPQVDMSDLSTRLEDRAIVANLPGGATSLDKLWKLAKLAAITQLALEGKATEDSPFAHSRNGLNQAAEVKHALSPRVVVNLLQEWKAGGFQYELDHYVFRALVDGALTALEKDYFYRMGRLQGLFMSSGWPAVVDDGSDRLYSTVESPRNPREAAPQTVPGRSLIEEIYGPAPERREYPDSFVAASEQLQHDASERVAAAAEVEELLGEIGELLDGTGWLNADTEG